MTPSDLVLTPTLNISDPFFPCTQTNPPKYIGTRTEQIITLCGEIGQKTKRPSPSITLSVVYIPNTGYITMPARSDVCTSPQAADNDRCSVKNHTLCECPRPLKGHRCG